MDKKKIGIIGATGFTGSELVRILANHSGVEIEVITSESRSEERFSEVHPFFQDVEDQKLVSVEELDNYNLDLVFLALPHGVSMDFVKKHHDKKFRIIDLSGDFRLNSEKDYQDWYGMKHVFPEAIKGAVFGLPELFKEEIIGADLVANPGCYPTSAILGIAPLLSHSFVDVAPLIFDSKSGVTGAGIKSKPVNLFSTVNENFKAYGLKKHRHTIEIQGTLDRVAGKETTVQFTPHLLPVDRGILTTAYARPKQAVNEASLTGVYKEFYIDAPFVRMRAQNPAIKDVRGSNYCDIHVNYDERTNMIIIVSVIDNLVKGAAGQAVQNMNLMLGFEETMGLGQVPVQP